jgi:hypothetical protein
MNLSLNNPIIKCNQPGCFFDTVSDKGLLTHYYYHHPSIKNVKSYLNNSNKIISDSHILYGVKILLEFKKAAV